jgi:hypothetical protein
MSIPPIPVALRIPTRNGEVIDYQAVQPALSLPRIYYVNGIQTDGETHARSATVLSILTERVVHGVYNATAGKNPLGMGGDLLQCLADWTDIFLSKLAEIGNGHVNRALNWLVDQTAGRFRPGPTNPINVANSIRQRIAPTHRLAFIDKCLSTYNKATASLFRELYTHLSDKQVIVAHSQGNLITADALWSLVIAFGENSLANLQIYSLASPSPAWPLGIRYRRKVYGHSNDAVTLADPHNWSIITSRLANGKYGRTAGDWRVFGSNWLSGFGIGGHDVNLNIAMNFATSIRKYLNLPPYPNPLPKI